MKRSKKPKRRRSLRRKPLLLKPLPQENLLLVPMSKLRVVPVVRLSLKVDLPQSLKL